jgi:catechol 2,3-dioxygenase-like lactoylglutathione lyase family enzyme
MLPDGGRDEMKLNYAIKFVSDMDAAVAFYRDTIGLKLGFQSPFWSEFETGETKLALHPASDENPAGSVQLGLGTADIDNFFAAGQSGGIVFTSPPTDMHGTRIARFRDIDGAEISVSG